MLYVRPNNRTEAEETIKTWNAEHERASKALAQARATIAHLEDAVRVASDYRNRALDDDKEMPLDDNPALLEAARRNAYDAVFGPAANRA